MPPTRIALLGECMLELTGTPLGAMTMGYGGDTLNTAVYLARCTCAHEVHVAYATALGDDHFSYRLLELWREEGIHTPWVQRMRGRLPGLYAIEVDAAGERHFSYWRSDSAARHQFDPPQTPLEEAAARAELDCLYVSGISLAILPSMGRQRLLALMHTVRSHGGQVVFDNNYRPRLWEDTSQAQTVFTQAMGAATIALITLDDQSALFGHQSWEDCWHHAQALNISEVIIKRGSKATMVCTPHTSPEAVPVQAVRATDTTAAGDSFAAGYLSRRLRGLPAREAAAFGNVLAGRVIQHPGALIPRHAMADLMPYG